MSRALMTRAWTTPFLSSQQWPLLCHTPPQLRGHPPLVHPHPLGWLPQQRGPLLVQPQSTEAMQQVQHALPATIALLNQAVCLVLRVDLSPSGFSGTCCINRRLTGTVGSVTFMSFTIRLNFEHKFSSSYQPGCRCPC